MNCGEEQTDAAIINPVESLWGLTNERSYVNCFGSENPLICRLEREYYELFKAIRLGGGAADYIDEGVFEKYGKEENGRLVVGRKSYGKIILNGNYNLRSSTLEALKNFVKNGGLLIVAGELPRYLDGVRHDFSGELLGAKNVGFNPDEVLRLIRSDDVSVSEGNIVSETRVFAEGKAYFFLNRAENAVKTTIKIKNKLNPVEINLYDGEKRPVSFKRLGEEVVIEKEFGRDDSLALLFDGENLKQENLTEKEAKFPDEFDYVLGEPNILPLDYADCFLDGGFFARGSVLDLDRKIREKFGVEQRHGEMIQPWFKEKFYPKPQKLCRVMLKYRFIIGETIKDVSFMTEDETAEIRVNGRLLNAEKSYGTEIDECFRLIPVDDDFLKPGENEITVSFDFDERYDIEGSFLCGNFGVFESDFENDFKKNIKIDVLKTLPKKLKREDFTTQGLKYFGGRITLQSPLKNGVYRLIARDLPCAACVINGKTAAFKPLLVDFEVLNESLSLTLAFTRQNTFGLDYSDKNSDKRSGLIPQGFPEEVELYELVP